MTTLLVGRSRGAAALAGLLLILARGGAAQDAPPAAGPERIAILAPLDLELAPLLERARVDERRPVAGQLHHLGSLAGRDVVLVRAGRSLVAAAAVAQAVLDHHRVRALIVAGIAGGIDPSREVADVVVPERWAQYQEHVVARRAGEGFDPAGRLRGATWDGFGAFFTRPGRLTWLRDGEDTLEDRFWFPADRSMLEAARRSARSDVLERCDPRGRCAPAPPRLVVGGQGVSGPGFVDNAEYREWIWRSFEASAVDQETAAVAQVAYMSGVPFLAFRGLSDLAGGREGANGVEDLGGLAAGNAARAVVQFLEAWEP